jgi:hypothetical protein
LRNTQAKIQHDYSDADLMLGEGAYVEEERLAQVWCHLEDVGQLGCWQLEQHLE